MAINDEYFKSIHFETVRRKYYYAYKVDETLKDIQNQVRLIREENEALKAQLAACSQKEKDVNEVLFVARSAAVQYMTMAKEKADAIVAEAEEKKRRSEEDSRKVQEDAVRLAGDMFLKMKEQQQACLDALNEEWQTFLCSLDQSGDEEDKPEDLEDKVGAIAREMFALEDEEPEEEEAAE